MPQPVKLLLNCLVVATLTFGGIVLITLLPTMDFSPYRWEHEIINVENRLALGYVYQILVWMVCATFVALLMLKLKPRKIFIYALVSAFTFVATLRSWHVIASGDIYNSSRELIWILTIPCLYWVFTRIAEQRHSE